MGSTRNPGRVAGLLYLLLVVMALLGEIAFMLWLVIKGAKPQPLDATASSPAAG